MRTRRANRVAGIFCLALGFTILSAAKPKGEADVQQERVAKALKAEAMGSRLDRAQMLEPLLSGETIADEVYWQAGYVKVNDRWVAHDKVSFDTQTQELLAEYAKYRDQHWGHEEEHIQIANWCREKGLNEQARAHLMSVLLKHPEHAGLREFLGYQRINGDWMNRVEFDAMQRDAVRLRARLEKWVPQISRICDGLVSKNPQRRQTALTDLSTVSDAAAIPAMELILIPHSLETARHCVDRLCEIRHRDATMALCRVALSSPSIELKLQAVNELKQRPWDEYVGVLLMQTRSEVTSVVRLATYPINLGRRIQRLFDVSIDASSEGIYSIDVVSNQVTGESIPRIAGIRTQRGVGRDFAELERRRTGNEVLLRIQDQLLTHVRAEVETNKIIDEFNRDVFTLLRQTTNQQFSDEPKEWWNWWNQYIGFELAEKSNRVIEIDESESISTTVLGSSCFTAGTPVWSEFGSRPIESLKIGDRVLTKNVETGELTYRPVIRTTYRETNQPLIRVQMGDEPITATGGHLFWVSGSGWIKARDLKPGHRVHTPTGTVEVAGVEEVATEPTYNLVIDGFHTYFVGNGKALCHDVSLASPTDAVVPGLLE